MAASENLDQESFKEQDPAIDINSVTLPGQLDETSPFSFDQRHVPNIPFSPTSPGKRSPGRLRTMKEYEDEITSLKKENFNLKVRIFFIEENRMDSNLPKDVEELRKNLTDLTVNFEYKKKELSDMEDLLLKSYKVIDTQKKQLEVLKSEQDTEKQALQIKIDSLEKELKESQMKFMETSVHLDDTNALYALTFGTNSKMGMEKEQDLIEKIKYLENDLEMEREKVMILDGENTQLKLKLVKDQDELKQLQDFVEEIKSDLGKLLKEKNHFEQSANEATSQLTVLENHIKHKREVIKEKEDEIEHLKSLLQTQEKNNDETSKQEHLHRKSLKLLQFENNHLKEKIKEIQKLSETQFLSLRNGWSDRERELHKKLKESELKKEELEKEINHQRTLYDNGQTLIQRLVKENKTLQRSLGPTKRTSRSQSSREMNSSKEEDVNEAIPSEKDDLISDLYCKIEELTLALREKELLIEELNKCELNESSKPGLSLKEDSSKHDKEVEDLTKELEQYKKEIETLKRELKKKTFNLQGLVNTELWDKNREIEKLNKVCERKHLETLALQKQIRELQKSVVQDKVNSFVSSYSLQNDLFTEDKENLQPVTDPMLQVCQLSEEKRLLTRKVEELQERLLNTPERDVESLLVQTLRNEKDQAEKMRKEAVNACLLLTTRLQELADFLDSLLPTLCGKKRKVVQQAVERSRELSRSLSLAADDSSLMHCSAWTDLQPSLYVPLLPDISTVDFWSGEDDEDFSEGGQVARLKSQVETLTEEVKLKDSELSRFQSTKQMSDSGVFKSIFDFHGQNILENDLILNNSSVNTAEVLKGSTFDTLSEKNTQLTKLTPEVKSANIGAITLSSVKKDSNVSYNLITFEDLHKTKESEYETWSEPDRDVSFARMGLKENSANVNKSLNEQLEETSETEDCPPKSTTPRRTSEVLRLQRKIQSLEQVNEALRKELVILHQLAPAETSRQDKATSVELSRQSLSSIPSHLLEEIRIQREKLEASLFHNDYIRRQLENTVLSLRKSQGDDQEKVSAVKLNDIKKQLEQAESEVTSLKSDKEQWNRKIDEVQSLLQQKTTDLLEKQCELLELEKKTSQQLKVVEEEYKGKVLQVEQKCEELEKKWLALQKDKEFMHHQIEDKSQEVTKLTGQVNHYEQEGKKNKQVIEELNLKIHQFSQKKEELLKKVSEQEQLLEDAERERQELATQLIARDRQVSDLQRQLTHMEHTSKELESALSTQLDVAKRREEESLGELQRRLDAARFAHSEAVLQYTRVANDNIRLQQQLRSPNNQMAQVERIKCELERRVAELEAVNAELERRLESLNVNRPTYSDYETDAGSSVVGSPRRNCPPPLLTSPQHTVPCFSTDLTSDYLSDQEAALSSPKAQIHNVWPSATPLTHSSTSPDLGIESDHGRFSSLEHAPRTTTLSLRAAPVKDLMKLEEENTQLRRNLQKTRHALEETLAQLTAANHHKRHYEAQLSAANQHKAKVERAISRQLHKTHSILKKARVNLENDGKDEQH